MSQVIKAIRFVVAGALLAAATAAWSCSISMNPPVYSRDKNNAPVSWYESNKLFIAKLTFNNWSEINTAAGVWLVVNDKCYLMGLSSLGTTSAEYTYTLNTTALAPGNYTFYAKMYYYIDGETYEARSEVFARPIRNGLELQIGQTTATVTSPTGIITAGNDLPVTSAHTAVWYNYSNDLNALTRTQGAHRTNWSPCGSPPNPNYTLSYSTIVISSLENGIGTSSTTIEPWTTVWSTCQTCPLGAYSAMAATDASAYSNGDLIPAACGSVEGTPISWMLTPPE